MVTSPPHLVRIIEDSFGQLSNGESASLFTLTNRQGMQVKITNFGGIIVSILAHDKTQRLADIVLGYDRVSDYEKDSYYLGAVIGRYAGRIEQGQFELDGELHQLKLNAPDSQLHGGKNALNKQLWQATTSQNNTSSTVTLTYTSPDGEEGFPGEVNFTVTYQFTDNNELIVEYFANTTKTTIVNLTQHSYFNLAGHDSGNIHHHQVCINADYFLPMSEKAYPTGEIKSVANTAHDFTQASCLTTNIDNTDDEQIRIGQGFDNYWLLNENALALNEFAAQAIDERSGRRLTIYTDQPSMILYTANYIDGSHYGKNNTQYQRRAALCLEPQRANNKDKGVNIENCKLTPQQPFYSQTRYVFDLI
ncbi:aldose epimerase family protein [Colwellia sp. 1_MG-2023]|uniref:aldose epimerase family protein n=1 Tax=Colwellia sp. 1_MG-2023 TaxID=3062649 RepID=UPI0026E48796|nr:aldose epimerase family protein [Colwellia sp. 1_MG-2023]MDO6444447.1 aldose epimerase family protein [Colwellia sp. 1_MG-2023]